MLHKKVEEPCLMLRKTWSTSLLSQVTCNPNRISHGKASFISKFLINTSFAVHFHHNTACFETSLNILINPLFPVSLTDTTLEKLISLQRFFETNEFDQISINAQTSILKVIQSSLRTTFTTAKLLIFRFCPSIFNLISWFQ